MTDDNTSTPATTPLSEKEVFLTSITTAYHSENFSDYKFSTPVKTDDNPSLSKEGGVDIWEISISIWPSPNNLFTATDKLADICFNAGVTFKSWIISADGNATLIPDGTTTTDPKLDRDHRGKEFCFYLKWNARTQQFEKTPEKCKELLLTLWRELIKMGSEYGYTTTTRIGEASFLAEAGIETPFTFTLHKLYTNRHGILNQQYRHLLQSPNPLADIKITYSDLFNYGIALDDIKRMLEKRIAYLEKHSKSSQLQWRDRFKQLAEKTVSDNPFDLSGVIKTLHALLNTTQSFSAKDITTIQGWIDQLLKHVPYDANNGQSSAAPFQVVCDLADRWTQIKTNNICDNLTRLNELLFDCEIQLTAETALLTAEFLKNAYCVEALRALSIPVSTLQSMCTTYPQQMLVLYRNARFLEDEFNGLAIEKENLNKHNQAWSNEANAKTAINQVLLGFYHYPWTPSLFTQNHAVEFKNVIGSNGKLLDPKTIKITPEAFKVVQLIQSAQSGRVCWTDTWKKIKQDRFALVGMRPASMLVVPMKTQSAALLTYESLNTLLPDVSIMDQQIYQQDQENQEEAQQSNGANREKTIARWFKKGTQ